MRAKEVDFFRGIAILMMAIFHFTWDLDYLGVVDLAMQKGFWGIFQTLTGGLFIFIVGVSLTLSYNASKNNKSILNRYPMRYILRGLRVFCYGLLITAGSLLFAEQTFVFFGILHFIGISIIIVTPFIRFRYINLLMGVVSLILGIYLKGFFFSSRWIVWIGFSNGVRTLDLYSILPWISLVFLGLFAGNLFYPKGKRAFKIRISKKMKQISLPVQFLGKNALLIYFIHLPLMYALAYVVRIIV